MANFQSKGWGLGLHWVWLPVIGFIFGFALIFVLLIIWLVQGHPRYMTDEATVVFVSDVGAANHAVFIVLGTLTAVFFFASILADFALRHRGRIPGRLRSKERIATGIAVVFSLLTAVFCILLTIFDAFKHDNLHWAFALAFFVCLVISGIANLTEIAALARSYPERRHLKASFWVKLFLIVLAFCTIVVIAGLYGYCDHKTPTGVSEYTTCNPQYSTVAAGEWFILFIFDLYILSIVLDLWPSIRSSRHVPRKNPQDLEMAPAGANGYDPHGQGPTGRTSPDPLNTLPASGPGLYEQVDVQPQQGQKASRGMGGNSYLNLGIQGHPHENRNGYVTNVPAGAPQAARGGPVGGNPYPMGGDSYTNLGIQGHPHDNRNGYVTNV